MSGNFENEDEMRKNAQNMLSMVEQARNKRKIKEPIDPNKPVEGFGEVTDEQFLTPEQIIEKNAKLREKALSGETYTEDDGDNMNEKSFSSGFETESGFPRGFNQPTTQMNRPEPEQKINPEPSKPVSFAGADDLTGKTSTRPKENVQHADAFNASFENPTEIYQNVANNKAKSQNNQNQIGSQNAGPLSRFINRLPATYISLPSSGLFYDNTEVNFNEDGQLPIYPMTARDEMLLKSPDALINGVAVEQVVHHCVPDILQPRKLTSPDFETIMVALRLATYGEQLDVEFSCPNENKDGQGTPCGNTVKYGFDCNELLSMSTALKVEPKVALYDNNVVAYVRPYNLTDALEIGKLQVEEQRSIQGLMVDENKTEEQKLGDLRGIYERISDKTTLINARCILRVDVKDENGDVSTENSHSNILEFVKNMPKREYDKIEYALTQLNKLGIPKDVDVTCDECGHKWTTQLSFDPSRFFS